MQKFTSSTPFLTESGQVLLQLDIAYHTYGTLAADGSNVIWVCHALTADSQVAEWWKGLFGEGRLLDPSRWFIVCANNLGSCYGTTGPLSIDPDTGTPYYHEFPEITVRDMVNAHDLLRKHLCIHKIHLILGGSLGGQQALEWAVSHPDLFDHLALIAANARHSPWGIAFNETQRMAIAADPTWVQNHPDAGREGLKVARSIALLSYRHYHTYDLSQGSEDVAHHRDYPAAAYQRYQGEKLARRFNAYTYWTLSRAMDAHHLGRHHGSVTTALHQIKSKTLVVSISSDLLFPPEEQQYIAQHIPHAVHHTINSNYGHDGFLMETAVLSELVRGFIKPSSNSQTLLLPLRPHISVRNVQSTY